MLRTSFFRFSLSVFFCSVLSFLGLSVLSASAATAGDLVKGSTAAVYYLAQNGKRYSFPNEKIYKTWFADFSLVKTVNDTELASHQLGGNVTYRPGVRLIKIPSVPKVYAVSHGAQLRWITTEDVARQAFGLDWAKQVDDLSEGFFFDYRIGADITSNGSYSAANELMAANTIQAELDARFGMSTTTSTTTPSTTPSSTSNSYTGTVGYVPPQPKIGDTVTISASAQMPSSISSIYLYLNNTLLQQCDHSPCSRDVSIDTTSTQSLRAEFSWLMGQHMTATSSLTVAPGISGVTLSIPRPEIRPGDAREAVLYVNNSSGAYIRAGIYLDNGLVKECVGTQIGECHYSEIDTSPTGTVHTVYATLTNTVGMVQQSETQTISVVANEHPLVSVTPAKSLILKGETIDVNVSAQDRDGITRTDVSLDGSVIKTCPNGLCSFTAGPWSQSRTLQFVVTATDGAGMMTTVTSTPVTVQ